MSSALQPVGYIGVAFENDDSRAAGGRDVSECQADSVAECHVDHVAGVGCDGRLIDKASIEPGQADRSDKRLEPGHFETRPRGGYAATADEAGVVDGLQHGGRGIHSERFGQAVADRQLQDVAHQFFGRGPPIGDRVDWPGIEFDESLVDHLNPLGVIATMAHHTVCHIPLDGSEAGGGFDLDGVFADGQIGGHGGCDD